MQKCTKLSDRTLFKFFNCTNSPQQWHLFRFDTRNSFLREDFFFFFCSGTDLFHQKNTKLQLVHPARSSKLTLLKLAGARWQCRHIKAGSGGDPAWSCQPLVLHWCNGGTQLTAANPQKAVRSVVNDRARDTRHAQGQTQVPWVIRPLARPVVLKLENTALINSTPSICLCCYWTPDVTSVMLPHIQFWLSGLFSRLTVLPSPHLFPY